MRTILLASKEGGGFMKIYSLYKSGLLVLAGIVALTLFGCKTIPKDALKLTPESLEKRTLQTRKYEGVSEADILAASAGVIQDLGFNIDESETKLGVIVGSKDRDAKETGQVLAAVFITLLGGKAGPIDDKQKMRVSLVVRPAHEDDAKNHFVRVTFQRMVWNTQGQISRVEGLDDPEMYQEFFDRLSKAVFLEGHKI